MQNYDLESFIGDNRNGFDDLEPDPRSWSAIAFHLNQKKKISFKMKRILAVAATFGLFLLSGVGAWMLDARSSTESLDLVYERVPELQKIEDHYNTLLETNFSNFNNQVNDKTVVSELDDLDNTIHNLKKELINAPSNLQTDIIDDLIDSYRFKVIILNRVLKQTPNDMPTGKSKSGNHGEIII